MRIPISRLSGLRSMLRALLALALLSFAIPAYATKVLVVSNTNGTVTTAADALVTKLQTKYPAVSDVIEKVDITTDVTGAGVNPLSFYDQIWDVRAQTTLTTNDINNYKTLLASGKAIFLMGENSGFGATRNAALVTAVAAFGGGTISGITGNASNSVAETITVAAFRTSQNTITTHTWNLACGLSTNAGNGAFLTSNGAGGGGSLIFAAGTMTNATAGTLIIVYDVNFISNAGAENVAFTQNLIAYVGLAASGALTPAVVFVPPVVIPPFVVAVPTDKPQQVVKEPNTVLSNVPIGTKVSDNGVLVLRTPTDGETNPTANITGTVPANSILQLAPAIPTTLTLGGQTLVFTPSKDSPVPVQIQTKAIQFLDNQGLPQTGTALQVIQGTATLTGPSGLPVSAFAGTTTSGCDNNIGYITPFQNNTQVFANASESSFLLLGHVSAGAVVVTFSSCTSTAKQNGFAAGAQQAKVFRGEQLYLDKLGQLDRIVVRSASGTVGDAGDPLKLTALTGFGFSPSLAVPQLSKDTGRIPASSTLQSRLAAVALAQFPTLQNGGWTFSGQDSLGVIRFTRSDQEVVMLPIGELRVNNGAPDSVVVSNTSQGIITANETSMVVSAMPRNIARLVSDIRALDSAANFQLVDDGTLRLSFKGLVYGMQPNWGTVFNTAFRALPAFGNDDVHARGICHYADGWKQCYYPIVNDFSSLHGLVKRLVPNATVVADRTGIVTVTETNKTFEMLPQYTTIPTPASRDKEDFWKENGLFFVKNPNGVSQGFEVRCPAGLTSAPFC